MKIAFDGALAQFVDAPWKSKETDQFPKSEREDQIAWNQKMRRSLQASQRAWLAYRVSACGAVSDSAAGGTIADEEVTFCKVGLTKERTKFLNDYFHHDN